MKPSDPLLLADVTLHCGMYPAGKVNISCHLAILGSPQSDHTVWQGQWEGWVTVPSAESNTVSLVITP